MLAAIDLAIGDWRLAIIDYRLAIGEGSQHTSVRRLSSVIPPSMLPSVSPSSASLSVHSCSSVCFKGGVGGDLWKSRFEMSFGMRCGVPQEFGVEASTKPLDQTTTLATTKTCTHRPWPITTSFTVLVIADLVFTVGRGIAVVHVVSVVVVIVGGVVVVGRVGCGGSVVRRVRQQQSEQTL